MGELSSTQNARLRLITTPARAQKTDVLVGEDLGQKRVSPTPLDLSVLADTANDEGCRIAKTGEASGIGTVGFSVELAWSHHSERLVWSLEVVPVGEGVEPPVLCLPGTSGWQHRLKFEGAMHSLEDSVLLRLSR